MLGLRQKLTLAFGGMLVILATVGTLSGLLLTKYSSTLERLFRENYDSVVFGQNMKDAVDGLDDLAQRSLWAETAPPETPTLADFVKRFEENLEREKGNITLSGEREVADEIAAAWQTYRSNHEELMTANKSAPDRREFYRKKLMPEAHEINRLAQRVIDMNLANIVSVDGQVKESAIFARNAMALLIVTGVALAILFTTLIGRFILKPLRTLTQSVHEIEKGNLDLTVNVRSKDELGQLADAFNAMAARLREFRRTDRAKLFRIQKTTQLALNAFPDAVAVIGLDGKIELANESAQKQFKLLPLADLAKAETKGLWDIFQQVYTTMSPLLPKGYDTAIQAFVDGKEHFFLPQAVPIISEDKQLTGVTLVLADVTELRRLDEMKSGLLSVVSHELKTPLTSIRMGTHLLLEERLGPLTPKQADILVTARDDAERLNTIVERLLDMGRIESGRALMEFKPVAAEKLVTEATEQFATAYRGRGVTLVTDIDADLPDVLADTSRIGHVFSNLLDNALKYTRSGGKVTVSAKADASQGGEFVVFKVADTGSGIPADALPRIFERFYRVPGQDQAIKGAGLGLAIAHEIIEAHGGSITAESKAGEGSTFTFRLRTANLPQQSSPRGV